jgi:hypothetical protein
VKALRRILHKLTASSCGPPDIFGKEAMMAGMLRLQEMLYNLFTSDFCSQLNQLSAIQWRQAFLSASGWPWWMTGRESHS